MVTEASPCICKMVWVTSHSSVSLWFLVCQAPELLIAGSGVIREIPAELSDVYRLEYTLQAGYHGSLDFDKSA